MTITTTCVGYTLAKSLFNSLLKKKTYPMKYTQLISIRFLAFVLCIIPAVVAHAQNDNGQTLEITAAEPDLGAGTMLITGTNFSRGATFDGIVQLFFPPDSGPADLVVVSFDPVSPQMILVESPAGIQDFPGTYLLRVRTKENKNSKHWGLVADFDVTFGAVGPVGADGELGPIGPFGPEGPQGPQGDTGLQGSEGPRGQMEHRVILVPKAHKGQELHRVQ